MLSAKQIMARTAFNVAPLTGADGRLALLTHTGNEAGIHRYLSYEKQPVMLSK